MTLTFLMMKRRTRAMKHKEQRRGILGILAAALLICSAAFTSFAAPGQLQQEKLSKNELKTLIATAKTSEDHLRIANYYRAQARDYLARQKQHQQDEQEYNAHPQMYKTKHPSAAQHCRDWAYNDGQSAKKAIALAEMHEKMARDVDK